MSYELRVMNLAASPIWSCSISNFQFNNSKHAYSYSHVFNKNLMFSCAHVFKTKPHVLMFSCLQNKNLMFSCAHVFKTKTSCSHVFSPIQAPFYSGLYPKLSSSRCELRQSLSTFTKVCRYTLLPKNFSSDLRASVDIFFSATPWCPMMMPFCESRST